MQSSLKILLTAGLGAATMYYLDPARGRYRRALTRARIEQGREALTHGVHKATHGLNRTTRRARSIGHNVGRGTDKVMHGFRTLGEEIGSGAEQVTHGARVIGREARDRAAGAAASLGSLIERHRADDGLDLQSSKKPRLKFLMIPVTWLVTVGLGAAAMYYLDPTQGLYRRARVRSRFARWRQKSKGSEGAQDADETAEQSRQGNGSGRRVHDQEPQPTRSL